MDNKALKLEEIQRILVEEYKDQISDGALVKLADDLYYTLFASQNELNDIMVALLQFEEEAEIDSFLSSALCIFCSMLDLLDENNEVTAQRLYDCFMNGFDCMETFAKLYNENAEYISAEKLARAKEKAFKTFHPALLYAYGIIE